jgi:hypothetical protein
MPNSEPSVETSTTESKFALGSYLQVIEHSLGLQRSPLAYRHQYCTTQDNPLLNEMVVLGMMQLGPLINEGRDRYFYVTEGGRRMVYPRYEVCRFCRRPISEGDYLDPTINDGYRCVRSACAPEW